MRGRGGGFFANRSFVRKAPTLAPSTPTGFVRRGNSLISVAALSSSSSSRFSSQNSPSACSAPSPSLPPPPTKPPSAPGASTVQLKYSFRHAQPPPTRSFALAHRGRYAPPGWRRQQPVRPPPSFLSRVLHQRARNLTLKTPSGSSPIALRISKERQLSVGGIQYRIARGGRSLLRISRDRSTPKKTQGQYVRSANGMSLIRQQRAPALRDILRTSAPRPLIPGQRKVKDCFMWTKTGKCNRVATCRNRHDPERVAVCRKFLLGECIDKDCPLQHKLAARDQMMPVCSFFLKGLCTNENCIYSHVKVNPDADVCQAFQEGFCPAGSSCTKLHTNVCQDFKLTGKCPRGAKCKLKHPATKKRRRVGGLAKDAKKMAESGGGERDRKAEEDEFSLSSTSTPAPLVTVTPHVSLLSGSILPSFSSEAPPSPSASTAPDHQVD